MTQKKPSTPPNTPSKDVVNGSNIFLLKCMGFSQKRQHDMALYDVCVQKSANSTAFDVRKGSAASPKLPSSPGMYRRAASLERSVSPFYRFVARQRQRALFARALSLTSLSLCLRLSAQRGPLLLSDESARPLDCRFEFEVRKWNGAAGGVTSTGDQRRSSRSRSTVNIMGSMYRRHFTSQRARGGARGGASQEDDYQPSESELRAFRKRLEENDYCTEIERKELGISPELVHQHTRTASRKLPIVSSEGPVEIIYKDSDVVAINKHSGVRSQPIHRFKGDSAVQRLVRVLGKAPLVVHRLDMQTSGALLFALHSKAASRLISQFQAREVRKRYLLIAAGIPSEAHFKVDAKIGPHANVKVMRAITPDGQAALTHFDVIATQTKAQWKERKAEIRSVLQQARKSSSPSSPFGHEEGGRKREEEDIDATIDDLERNFPEEGVSFIMAAPHTGRTHQIRLHITHKGHPILGDDLYGPQGLWIDRLALHSHSLELNHPDCCSTDSQDSSNIECPPSSSGTSSKSGSAGNNGGENGRRLLALRAPLPPDMAHACRLLGLDVPRELILPGLSIDTAEEDD
eukprot:jgi/Bigna1/69903/fgenesh1_pg.10_\